MVAPEALEANPFFESLTADERALLAPLAERREFKAGETVFSEGAASDALCVLERGLVSFRQHQRHGGEDASMGTVGEPGAVFGISAVVGEEHLYSHSAVCLEDSTVVALSGRDLLALCEEHPRAGVHLLKHVTSIMARRLSEAREQIRSRVRPGLISHG